MSKNNQQPFKKRVEIVFGENDKDLWEWLENKGQKATFIKKTLRALMNENLLSNDDIKEMIKEEVQKAISSTAVPLINQDTNENEKTNNESNQEQVVNTNMFFKGREF